MTPVDATARRDALDPCRSFCISAPAGSGKTGLLVQRFLVLLGRVEAPEGVVAITFTRKAAAEMRARVLQALRSAATDEAAGSEHEQRTLDAARRVLARDAEAHWGLLGNPARLSIQTIDSFCGELTRQMPVLSGCGGPVSATDDADGLYREAVERFLAATLDGDGTQRPDLEALLLHLDNRWESAIALLSRLLGRREQWQRVFGSRGLGDEERQVLRETAAALVAHRLSRLRRHLSPWAGRLATLSAYRAAQLGASKAFSPDSDRLDAWQPVADLLLTKDGAWRRRVDKRAGFPAGAGEAAERKAEITELLQELAEQDDETLREAIAGLRLLPDPDADSEHWGVLASLTRLLPQLLAELLLVFQQRGEVDHAQIALAALDALGADATPTDVALRLDHRIDHLLVDEFQDTSSLQFELIRRLTRGWAEHNEQNPAAARTLLLVGDPMQSIYGFREANVGLFIRARDEGIGDLTLEPLDLSVNFRSAAALVTWSNGCFARAFPPLDDPAVGAVAFRAADAARGGSVEPAIRVFGGPGAAAAEVDALCDAVAAGLEDGSARRSTAILGRSRRQLRPFLQALRERGIPFSARDFDPLAARPAIRDLLTLTTVLGDRFDRFAWLSLLRTPPVALGNDDLLVMARQAPVAASLVTATGTADAPAGLSAAGRERVEHLAAVLAWAEHYRDRLALRVWVEESWLRLGGAAALDSDAAVDDLRQFFRLLEDIELAQRPLGARSLGQALDSLYASADDDPGVVQVMTLHKAKGLEFDRVFIPALGSPTRQSDAELLLWDEVILPDAPPAVMLDIRAEVGGASQGRLYDFLVAQQRRKAELEATRLLYVGCTRAVDDLWLSGTVKWEQDDEEPRPPRAGSLLAALWRSLPERPEVTFAADGDEEEAATLRYRRVARLPPRPRVETLTPARGEDFVDARLAKSLGTAVHRCLESLVYREVLPHGCDDALKALLRASLIDSGTDLNHVAAQCAAGMQTLDRVLADDWLRWALDGGRAARAAELPLTVATEEGTQALVLDYVFTDEATGERWIVDYKTAEPRPGESVDAFESAQCERYRPQIEAYRRALTLAAPGPVRCALYFTALGRCREVPARQPC